MFVNKLKEIGYNKWLSLELFNEKLWKEEAQYKVSKDILGSLIGLLKI